ncbi:rhodanese-like domain-containing protein [Micromonospora sp. ANENR4]|uniref:rhodanese-like domain-containing protein n=1 Tax=Micromonospora sp. ANENR4 TaxID=2783662 RepID=UPI00188F4BD9|nr:rhodanese-like domain-containing protein [Micromonospora sp. ANENR4]MBF5034044.1 rhodanese-like domain-containing protein [Micromonospora sp. ANENR4]
MIEAPTIDVVTAARMNSGGRATLLDVREPDEWAAGQAPGARHVPLAQLDPPTVGSRRPVIEVCRCGRRSAAAAGTLRVARLNARDLTGGMTAWAQASLPVVTDDGKPGTVA